MPWHHCLGIQHILMNRKRLCPKACVGHCDKRPLCCCRNGTEHVVMYGHHALQSESTSNRRLRITRSDLALNRMKKFLPNLANCCLTWQGKSPATVAGFGLAPYPVFLYSPKKPEKAVSSWRRFILHSSDPNC